MTADRYQAGVAEGFLLQVVWGKWSSSGPLTQLPLPDVYLVYLVTTTCTFPGGGRVVVSVPLELASCLPATFVPLPIYADGTLGMEL